MMKYFAKLLPAVLLLVFAGIVTTPSFAAAAQNGTAASYPGHLAMTPPMGWNSYDAYWGDVNEAEVRANADYMAKHLAKYGWKYIVVDYYWYFLHPKAGISEETEEVAMDRYGRLMPPVNRFPSAANGRGFKPLADYVHSLGLRFGIHIMRGIPRAAVKQNLPILGTRFHARDVADLKNNCSWSTAMDGVDVSKPGGQAYYDSIARLYASWGVDFIKADDMSSARDPEGETYHGPEIEALRTAMSRTGRPMVLSLSPGPTAISDARSVMKWSQMWRISGDMWDTWGQLLRQFDYCRDWAQFGGPNHWPDADMLPIGRIRIRGYGTREPSHTRLTADEQTTLMTLWSIFRSPLMMGGDLPSLDRFTLSLLTNPEVLAVDQHSVGNHEILRPPHAVIWEADVPGSRAKYVAFFNTGEQSQHLSVGFNKLGLGGRVAVRDLWQEKNLGAAAQSWGAQVDAHGARLFKLSPAK
ncbi:MAG: glycoside hydrolase family 27 protein [Terriglobia bacterium]